MRSKQDMNCILKNLDPFNYTIIHAMSNFFLSLEFSGKLISCVSLGFATLSLYGMP